VTGRGGGLFLDLDGTLADSVPALRHAYEAWLASSGRRGSDAEFESCNGLPLPEVVARLRAAHGLPEPPAALLRTLLAEVGRAHAASPPRAGARALLERARAARSPVAVVTSAPGRVARRWLARHELLGLVEHVVGGDDVQRGKPDPEPYRRALALCACTARRSLAVEDSRSGVLSAVAAGVPTLVLASPDDPPPLALAEHEGVVGVIARLVDVAARLAS